MGGQANSRKVRKTKVNKKRLLDYVNNVPKAIATNKDRYGNIIDNGNILSSVFRITKVDNNTTIETMYVFDDGVEIEVKTYLEKETFFTVIKKNGFTFDHTVCVRKENENKQLYLI